MDSGTASRGGLMHVSRTVFAQIMDYLRGRHSVPTAVTPHDLCPVAGGLWPVRESVVERRGGSLSPSGRGTRAGTRPSFGERPARSTCSLPSSKTSQPQCFAAHASTDSLRHARGKLDLAEALTLESQEQNDALCLTNWNYSTFNRTVVMSNVQCLMSNDQ